jgi:AcrR family transcriptional regulator
MRQKNFNESVVLSQMCECFSEHGFEGTSLSQIMKKTGLAKQSLYNTFGDKNSIILKCLDHSVKNYSPARWLYSDSVTCKNALLNFFTEVCKECFASPISSCLVTSLLLEKANCDAILGRVAAQKWSATKEALEQCFLLGIQKREFVESFHVKENQVQSDAVVESTSTALMMLLSGMRAMCKAVNDETAALAAVTYAIERILPESRHP